MSETAPSFANSESVTKSASVNAVTCAGQLDAAQQKIARLASEATAAASQLSKLEASAAAADAAAAADNAQLSSDCQTLR